jgi:hypothetical protein
MPLPTAGQGEAEELAVVDHVERAPAAIGDA